MKKPKLVLLRGKPTAGKSTALKKLQKNEKVKDWVVINHQELKHWFSNLQEKEKKKLQKHILITVLKNLMKEKKNIIMDEFSRKALQNHLGRYIKKYQYSIIVFQFEVSKKEAYKRDKKRSKQRKVSPMGKAWVDQTQEQHKKNIDEEAIIIDTDKLSKKKVIKTIMEEIK